MKITLQVPISEYGTLATLAALAKMPIDKYVVTHKDLSKTASILAEEK